MSILFLLDDFFSWFKKLLTFDGKSSIMKAQEVFIIVCTNRDVHKYKKAYRLMKGAIYEKEKIKIVCLFT